MRLNSFALVALFQPARTGPFCAHYSLVNVSACYIRKCLYQFTDNCHLIVIYKKLFLIYNIFEVYLDVVSMSSVIMTTDDPSCLWFMNKSAIT